MRSIFSMVLVFGAAVSAARVVRADPPSSTDADEQRIVELENTVARLREEEREPISEERAEAIRLLVSDVLADADTRSALLDDEITAGWDEGFFIGSPDGRFKLELSGQIQTRFVWNRRQRNDGNETDYGFEMRRVKLKFDGHVEDVGFSIGLAVPAATGEARLQSFNVRFPIGDDLQLVVGRARPPLAREENISSKRQLAAERSLVSSTFRQTRTLGVTLRYRGETLRLAGGFMDASDLFEDDSWRTSARADLLLMGDWDATEDFTSFRDDEPMVAIGAGVFYEKRDDDLLDDADRQIFRASADLMIELGGATAFAAVTSNREDRDKGGTVNQFGAVVQTGFFVSDETEMFARYEWGDADGDAPGLSVFTVGFNRYFRRHELKWTFDVGYGLNEVDLFWSTSGAGWRRDRAGEDGQVVVRAQFQLLF